MEVPCEDADDAGTQQKSETEKGDEEEEEDEQEVVAGEDDAGCPDENCDETADAAIHALDDETPKKSFSGKCLLLHADAFADIRA